ncbi:hypothetical protein ABOM_006036 [Aspergillus bombycis]|uniref:FAD-binding domain-containing protein n=1 Tax=Aspergillus bombycis TaxID=109264 RepID=A0A1F8A2F6_9EURO|nr:hypothetical protein ABOM_006036 [Aspergillus bombycis]OGM45891.1 hypothetical protein ABOM_006036 [Aspergillus bombycis]
MSIDDTPEPLRIVIIGAGIAGLSAAIALSKQGHHVIVIEKSKFARETGAAIHIPPNCTALLQWMDVDPKDFGGTLIEQIHRYDSNGELKYKKELSGIREQWQAEWYLVHRVDLHNYLKERLNRTEATLHLGCKITNINIESEQPTVTLDDGREFTCDLLLGADGLHSMLRTHIIPNFPSPYPVGKSTFRWLLQTDELKTHEATKDVVGDPGVFVEWAANDRRVVAYPCSNNKIFNLVGFMPTAESGSYDEGWQAAGDKSALAKGFSGFAPSVRKMIDMAGDDLKVWALADMERMPTWVRGRAALVGDSAHPFQPFMVFDMVDCLVDMKLTKETKDMGQGAAMAIEDALSIATLLPLGTKAEGIPSRLAIYEKARQPRVENILKYTRLNGADENDPSVQRMTAAEMVKAMGICFVHNEIEHSRQLLEEERGVRL